MKAPELTPPVPQLQPQQFVAYAWLTPDGHWVACGERQTVVGMRTMVWKTPDINKAYVGHSLPRTNISDEVINFDKLTRLPVLLQTMRTVTIRDAVETVQVKNQANVEFGELGSK